MVVKRYPHAITIEKTTGSLENGIYVEGESTAVTVDCNIQQQKKSYKDGDNEDSNTTKWNIFCALFDDSNLVGLGDMIIPITGPTEFDDKPSHKIISYVIYQRHIEIEV